jgi:hypothetical protein
MTRTLLTAVLVASSAVVIQAQEPQTIKGVLMDAGCSAIEAKRSAKAVPGSTDNLPRTTATEAAEKKKDEATSKDTSITGSTHRTAGPGATGIHSQTGEHSGGEGKSSGAGQRSRSADIDPQYRQCGIKPASTEFAIYSNGKVYVLDAQSNKILGDRITEQNWTANQEGWIDVAATGTDRNGSFSATKVDRVR